MARPLPPLRSCAPTRPRELANGNYGAFLSSLNGSLQYTGGSTDAGSILRKNGFPDNYLVPDPQYSMVTIEGNNQNSTYHSMQLQLTRRLSEGFSTGATYIWSKALQAGTAGTGTAGGVADPSNRNESKRLQDVDHAHQISTNATYELPFGTGHFLLGNAPSWVQQIVNKWQLGGFGNFNTGAPLSITSNLSTISGATSRPSVVGKIPSDMGKITKLANGVTYFDGFTQVQDPGFANISPLNGLNSAYTNKAIKDPNGNIILVNPQPGQIGTLGYGTIRGPKSLYFDMNLIKRFNVTETKQLEFRLDVVNILNHPNFAAPTLAMNGTTGTFGNITSLAAGSNIGGNGGMRSFIFNTRVNF